MEPSTSVIEGRDVQIEWSGKAKLHADTIHLSESFSSVYALTAALFTIDPTVSVEGFLGERLTMSFQAGEDRRSFTGICVDASAPSVETHLQRFTLRMRPWIWALGQNVDTRVFQDINCLNLIKAIFAQYNMSQFEDKTRGTYKRIEYIVQHDETDLNFVHRVMEEHGLYYFFRHDPDGEKLILCDDVSSHGPLSGHFKIPFYPPDASFHRNQEYVSQIEASQALVPSKVSSRGMDFTKIRPDLSVTKSMDGLPGFGEKMEIYRHTDPHTELGAGEAKVSIAIESLQASQHVVRGICNVRAMAIGSRFAVYGHENLAFNREYLIVSAHHALVGEHDHPRGDGDDYSCHFEAIPADRPYRSARKTPRPRINSIQTAIVVGPAGEEIYTDEYGRVRLQFYWDRLGKNDQHSSRWVRVAMPWTGQNWGFQFIPRIGQEVVVQFENGDPDRPIVTGMLYNKGNMPPYPLPQNMTQSGIRTHSTKEGSGFNEVQFEDKKGAEELNLTAERNYSLTVKGEATVSVGGNQTTSVNGDRTASIGKSDVLHASEIHITAQQGDGGNGVVVIDATEGVQITAGTTFVSFNKECIEMFVGDGGTSSIKMYPGEIRIDSPLIKLNCS